MHMCHILNFPVGAALLGGRRDSVIMAVILKMQAYGMTNCAERTAFFKAVSRRCEIHLKQLLLLRIQKVHSRHVEHVDK